MKNLLIAIALTLCIFSSAQTVFSGESLEQAKVAVANQRVCRLQVVRRNGQLLVVDRLTGRFVTDRNGRLIRANQLRRNNQNVVFLNRNRVVISAVLSANLLQNRVVVIRY